MAAKRADSFSEQADPPRQAERRRFRRIPVKLRLTVRTLDDQTQPISLSETTTTESVSPGDLYFLSAIYQRLRVGSRLKLYIDLPLASSSSNLFADRHLQVNGQVVRFGPTDAQDPSRRGVAVRFLSTPRFTTELE